MSTKLDNALATLAKLCHRRYNLSIRRELFEGHWEISLNHSWGNGFPHKKCGVLYSINEIDKDLGRCARKILATLRKEYHL